MKQHWSKLALASVVLACSTSAMAEFEGSVAVTSDYIFDGVSQTDNKPAVQVGLDYGMDSGFYVGGWFSNVDFGDDTNLETDVYAGITFGSEAVSTDLGVVYYYYSESFSPLDDNSDYYEAYVGVTFAENFTVKGWFTPDYANSDESAYRIKGTYSAPINDTFSIPLEYTYTDIDGNDFNHFRVGFAMDFSPITVDISYHKTDIDVGALDDPDLVAADGLIVGTVTFAF